MPCNERITKEDAGDDCAIDVDLSCLTIQKGENKTQNANMVEILLTCNPQDLDNALVLKSSIQRKLEINVFLQVGDDEDLDDMVDQATVLLVFEFGDASISAWVTIDDVDVADSNYEETSFPETIDCSKDVS